MKICKIRLLNLNSLRGENEIDFQKPPLDNAGLFAITGDTGAGKTTILDAITLAMYGQVPRHTDPKEILSYGAVECYAEVEFEVHSHRYRSKWSLWRAYGKPDGNLNGPDMELSRRNATTGEFEYLADKISTVKKQVEHITGLDYTRFTRSVLLSQGEFAAFLESNEKMRSELLERITGTQIYTQLSKAAFERHKIEREKTERLRLRMNELSLLSPEDKQALTQERKDLQTHIDQQLQQLQQIRQQVQWRISWEEKTMTLADWKEKKINFEAAQISFKEKDHQRILHRKALPVRNTLQKLQEVTEQCEKAHHNVHSLQSEWESVHNAQVQTSQKNEHLIAAITVQEEALTDIRKVAAQVKLLDSRVTEMRQHHKTLSDKVRAQQAQQASLQQTQNKLQDNLLQAQQDQEQVRQWLLEHETYKDLQDQIPHLLQQHRSLREWNQECQHLLQKRTKQQDEISEITNQIIALQHTLEEYEKDRLSAIQSFRAETPEQYVDSRKELLGKLQSELIRNTQRLGEYKEFQRLKTSYRKMLKKLWDIHEEKESLLIQELVIGKELLNSETQLRNLEQEWESRQDIYIQQKKIADYTADRARLQPGQPCPLCLSKEHPFRLLQIKPFVDQAKKDLERAKQSLHNHRQEHAKLTTHHQELLSRISLFIQMDEDQVQATSAEMEALEADIAAHLQAASYEVSEESLAVQTKLLEKLNKWDKQASKLERVIELKQQDLRENRMRAELLKKENHHHQKRIEELELKINRATQALQKTFDTYNTPSGTMTEQLSALQAFRQSWQDFQKQLIQSSNDIKLQERDIQNTLEQLQKTTLLLQDSQSEAKQWNQKKNAAQEERQQLLQAKDPDKVVEDAEYFLSTLKADAAAISERLQKQNLQIERLQTRKEEQLQIAKNWEQQQAALFEQVETQAIAAGFENWMSLQDALLPDDYYEALNTKAEQLEKQELEISLNLKVAQQAVDEHRELQLQVPPLEDLNERVHSLEGELQQQQQEVGRITERLEKDAAQRKRRIRLEKEWKAQRKEQNRWAALDELIGQASGKKFRAFAQSLTLQHLCNLANVHLQKLSGRYAIRKRSGQSMTLEVEDRYQANNMRSMNSLSGGEQFQISLALALGLSNLTGQHARIESLFIDEGFGTLDETTLDTAISTLENLQANGKTIGIISHVPVLKERIAVQVRINKRGNGNSVIEVV